MQQTETDGPPCVNNLSLMIASLRLGCKVVKATATQQGNYIACGTWAHLISWLSFTGSMRRTYVACAETRLPVTVFSSMSVTT